MIPLLSPLAAAASTPPTDAIWYGLQRYYLFFGISAGIIVIGFMIWTTIHHRTPRYAEKQGEYAFHPRENNWGNWKTILPLILITVSVQAFVEYQTFASTGLYVPPKAGDPITIGVIGRQWDWEFVYPDGVQFVGNLTVPKDEEVILNITSTDVFHSFTIPALSVARDAIPGHYNTLWFNATQTGSYLILCKELCGVGHALMIAHLSVISQPDFQTWYSTLRANSTSGGGASQ
jgi:cytochrome c oxidase subunit 2